MRDMPAPPPAPPPVDHGRHDPLLIAQLAAGDPLTTDQEQQAAHLVARCADCAALAADLRVISSAVAWEPLPPRRRDFYIDPARAAALRGSILQRFLRRLSVPETRGLRPAAAGILSVGLLFMVAGAAWPTDDAAMPPAEPDPSPALMMQMEAPAVTDAGPGAPAPLGESNAASEAEAFSAADAQADDRAITDPAAGLAAEEVVVDAPAGMAAEEPIVDSAAGAAEEAGVAAQKAGVEAPAAADVVAEGLVQDDLEAIQDDVAGTDDETLRAKAMAAQPSVGTADTGAASLSGAVPAAVEGGGSTSPESILVILGVVLAVTGGGLLLLTWLSRRAADPLLR